MIGLLDYDAGNLTSVQAALKFCGAEFRVLTRPEEFGSIDKLIVPGVGEARAAMEYLNSNELGDAITSFTKSGKPFLGICLGSQIILDYSEERETACLGILPGTCRSLSQSYKKSAVDDKEFKVPHIGWNQVHWNEGDPDPLFQGIPQGRSFYFDHGYFTDPTSPSDILGTSEHGIVFPAVIGRDNVKAVQFHPEKSGNYGLRLLKNFIDGSW